ncbi:hypothetical protein [Sulfurimonas paralvinellae]|uniref:Cysteine-rich small domain-containing protein n=1 Tax=Sulfurimonas paralvinellae TaxID=317658 RepID=A0A7M1B539_9BACT|nr:hypothetical protein [Sulfurimonas paralvinellae]QOP44844.1 hypothetical protein FM071_00425 [Sulfurimonas paralvinellae]
MSYNKWLREHAQKHKEIIEKLLAENLTQDEIIEYFDFDNMKNKERDFCPLYAQNKKCHDMEELNCYLCSCPNFCFSDKGIKKVDDKTQYSYCGIDSKDGRQGVYGETIHQDCSGCQIPHTKAYVAKHFNLDWSKIMSICEVKSANNH